MTPISIHRLILAVYLSIPFGSNEEVQEHAARQALDLKQRTTQYVHRRYNTDTEIGASRLTFHR